MLIIVCYCKCDAEESEKAGRRVPLLIVLVILVLSHPTQVNLKQKMGKIVESLFENHSKFYVVDTKLCSRDFWWLPSSKSVA